MTGARQRAFFDTDACSILAAAETQEREAVRRLVLRTYAYVVSPMTMVELLLRLHRGDEEHFAARQRPLQFLHGPGKPPTMLELPGQFLLKTVLGIHQARPDFEPAQLLKWLRVAIRARQRRDLTEGIVLPGQTGVVLNGLDIAMIHAQLQEGKEDHARRLEYARDEHAPSLPPREWARTLLSFLRVEPADERCDRLADAARAAYTLDCTLWHLARTSGYDFAQHDSDWIDRQQLDYLADQRMVMITNERRLPTRIVGSRQEDRVIRLEAFRAAVAPQVHG